MGEARLYWIAFAHNYKLCKKKSEEIKQTAWFLENIFVGTLCPRFFFAQLLIKCVCLPKESSKTLLASSLIKFSFWSLDIIVFNETIFLFWRRMVCFNTSTLCFLFLFHWWAYEFHALKIAIWVYQYFLADLRQHNMKNNFSRRKKN